MPKYNTKIEAYGTIDELMAHTSLLRYMCDEVKIKEDLLFILERLMSAASVIAAEGDNLPENMPFLSEGDVVFLEERIDIMDQELPTLNSFILPGGAILSSQAHITRTVCRRAERIIIKLAEKETVNIVIIKFLNRLSDYYFLLSRKLAIISGINEIPWKP